VTDCFNGLRDKANINKVEDKQSFLVATTTTSKHNDKATTVVKVYVVSVCLSVVTRLGPALLKNCLQKQYFDR